MIFCVSFAEFISFLARQGYGRVAETDSRFLYRGARGVVTVHKPNGDTITVIEVDRVCNLAGLTPPDLDQFRGDRVTGSAPPAPR